MKRPPRQRTPRGATAAPPAAGSDGPAVHLPVMVEAVIEVLAPRDGALYIDATFGAGGYSCALLEAANCRVVAIDRDPDAVRRGDELAAAYGGRFAMREGNFGDMERLVAAVASHPIAGVAFDLGVSSIQLDSPERGFSFRHDGPLDMRMGSAGQNAGDLVNALSETELAGLIHEFGEERHARRIARAIVATRQQNPVRRTVDLADIVRAAIPRPEPGLDPATRTFQALRIAVNDELGELDRGLEAAERLLKPDGRLAVVSFHSLEDRRAKKFLRQRSETAPQPSRHEPPPQSAPAPSFRLLRQRAIKPTADEIARNPRARSARLRAAERTAAPPWSLRRDR